jgi:hypothetical protein
MLHVEITQELKVISMGREREKGRKEKGKA